MDEIKRDDKLNKHQEPLADSAVMLLQHLLDHLNIAKELAIALQNFDLATILREEADKLSLTTLGDKKYGIIER
jgi:hypothetical protein